MNCKPGNFCRIVSTFETRSLGLVDRFVTVLEVMKNSLGDDSWSYEGPKLAMVSGVLVDCIPDKFLRPIRDPGEDARDETLSWLDVPLPEITPAMLDREVEHG